MTAEPTRCAMCGEPIVPAGTAQPHHPAVPEGEWRAAPQVIDARSDFEKLRARAEALEARVERAERERDEIGLTVTNEWAFVFATLAASVVESLETVTDLELKVKRGHPYYWGQMSLLQTLRKMAAADAERFGSTPAALDEFLAEPWAAPRAVDGEGEGG